MAKIPYNSFVQSMKMFFINEDIDKKYFELRNTKLNNLRLQLNDINTREGLKKYICEHEDSIDNLLVLLGVSTELFKRIVSLFRIERGMTFKTEWDARGVRKFVLTDSAMFDKICDLFLKGPEDPSLSKQIPNYRLSDFALNETVMKRIQNDDFLDFLISKDFDTAYNSDVSQSIIKQIDTILRSLCNNKNFELRQNCPVDAAGNGTQQIQVNYVLCKKGIELPLYYIKYSFNVTTSRGQTDFKRSVQNMRAYIRSKNPEARQIVIIDGAGWVGRQSDLHDVWDYSDYCLNLNSIAELNNIIK